MQSLSSNGGDGITINEEVKGRNIHFADIQTGAQTVTLHEVFWNSVIILPCDKLFIPLSLQPQWCLLLWKH